MKTPKWSDGRNGRYYSAEESKQPGYLERRMKAYARLQRLREASKDTHVVSITARKARG